MEKKTIIKNPIIETIIWGSVKRKLIDQKMEEKAKFNNTNELVSDLLIRYRTKTITFDDYKQGERKAKNIALTEEAFNVYINIPEKGRSYVINGLLRTWVKENS